MSKNATEVNLEAEQDISEEDMEMAGLTDSERAALGVDLDDDTADVDDTEAKAAEEADDEDAAEEEVKGADDKAVDDDAAAKAAEEAAAADVVDAKKANEPAPDAADKRFTPEFKAETSADNQENIDRLTTEMVALAEKLDEGDITAAEFQKENIALNDQRNALIAEASKAETFNEMNRQTAQQTWDSEQKTFFTSEAGKIYDSNKALFAAFNESVKEVAREDAFADRSGAAILAEADNRVKALMGMATNTVEPKKSTKAADELAARKAGQKGNVVTLGDLPAADKSDTSAGEFAALDALDGLELEEAVNAMSPQTRERYYKS